MELININFKEFKEEVYQKYIEIFPEEERKSLETMKKNYNKKITSFIKLLKLINNWIFNKNSVENTRYMPTGLFCDFTRISK